MSATLGFSVLLCCDALFMSTSAAPVYSQPNLNFTPTSDDEFPDSSFSPSYGNIHFQIASLDYLADYVCSPSSPFYDNTTSKCRVTSTLCLFGHKLHVTSRKSSSQHILDLCTNPRLGGDVDSVRETFVVNRARPFSDMNKTWLGLAVPFFRGLPKKGYIQLIFVVSIPRSNDSGRRSIDSLVLTLPMPAKAGWSDWTIYSNQDGNDSLSVDVNNSLAFSARWRVTCSSGYFPEGQCRVHTFCSPSTPCTLSCSADGVATCASGCERSKSSKYRGLCLQAGIDHLKIWFQNYRTGDHTAVATA